METIKSAKEYIIDNLKDNSNIDELVKLLINYTKQHVTKALHTASEEAYLCVNDPYGSYIEKSISYSEGTYHKTIMIDKSSIIESYLLDNIK